MSAFWIPKNKNPRLKKRFYRKKQNSNCGSFLPKKQTRYKWHCQSSHQLLYHCYVKVD